MYKVGDKTKSTDCLVIAVKDITNTRKINARQEQVILCLRQDDNPEHYVTWIVNEDGHTFSGHYFADFHYAAIDFRDRGRRWILW